MDFRDLALGLTVIPLAPKSGPWDWEKQCQMPKLRVVSAITAVVSWLAARLARPTVPALRAAHA